DADIVQSDVMASNGIIHVVDKVLMPPGAMAAVNSALPASATAKEPNTLPAKQVLPKQK
ncbi:MAG: fasciclin domain-containing protein, partial [Phenylobacterium sp.]|nr:fasciclin domain-containing protein [Phenylobacterium sp.]